jgi:tripartite-type tricarboxylate transporter receptor subunit TctC
LSQKSDRRQHHKEGNTIRCLAALPLKAAGFCNALIPDVPTIDEAGLPGYAAANWNGILAVS